MEPPVRPPRLRCGLFPSIYLPHLLVLPATFWTSALLAALSVFPSLICGFCPSGQRFAYSFLQIPPHDGHPCCSAMCFVVAYAHSGLSPVRARPWRANGKQGVRILSSHPVARGELRFSPLIKTFFNFFFEPVHSPVNSLFRNAERVSYFAGRIALYLH